LHPQISPIKKCPGIKINICEYLDHLRITAFFIAYQPKVIRREHSPVF